jgi:predicted dehydrogenase
MAKKRYGLGKEAALRRIAAPVLPYEPRDPKRYRPGIGLIGCGGISQQHLTAYKRAGYRVVALCDIDESRAQKRREEFYPRAGVYRDFRELLKRQDIEVVDVATHPEVRAGQVKEALRAGKHVLSQKPFVLDLDEGRRLVDLAERKGLRLAVNQNGRWAPHFSYMRQAVARGLIGDVIGAHLAVHWNHDWTAATPFNNVHHLILYDFAIHWFDILSCFMQGRKAKRVYAGLARAPGQRAKPPLLGQAIVEYDGAQASLGFDGFAQFGPRDTTYLAGTAGSLISEGPSLMRQKVTIHTERGYGSPKLRGAWFPDGFHGTMGELLCAIEEKREPFNSARNNLASLELCFAALKSADTGQPQHPGSVRAV